MMSKRLFVGNLSWDTQEDDLIAAFEAGGGKVASARIMTDRDTGKPRGFAFVESVLPASVSESANPAA